jgi:predicted O-methyltransferase YrrM
MKKHTHIKLIEIINAHIKDDLNDLILKKNNKEFVDISKNDFNFVVNQIACKQKYKEKFPIIIQEQQFKFLNILSAEQASSEITAYYKSNVIEEYNTSIDLTGGLGIDTIYFSKKSNKHIYCESDLELYKRFVHNYKILNLTKIKCSNDTAEEFIKKSDKHYDILYIDPSRRDKDNSDYKLFLIEELTPNILTLQKYFPKIADKIIIKLSPMLDISAVLEQIKNTSEVHIVSINNDCKELLLVCDYKKSINKILFVGINFICDYKNATNKDIKSIITETQRFEYYLTNTNKMRYAADVEKFIFEPNPSIMKLACWSELCDNFNIYKLHPNSNLFTANKIKNKFPGFTYKVVAVVNYDKEKILDIIGEKNKVSIKCRNFPDSVDKVRATLKLKDGNDYYLFCTTLIDNKPKIIISIKNCHYIT